ncbi:tripartite motif-containing protein 2-like [Dendronephthya gigantea]|uniref:tripartite motif-containing protein 2-like n=1 Tax=Dendronephthya gigantea TaxID=151771 RepID=UPI00106B5B0F|nr:tripartite motif-containing protein 2-like [Dendronephthya gigantea]
MWELLICHMCKNLLENPKVLTCAHAVCEKCLRSLMPKKYTETFKCPACCATIQAFVDIDNNFLSNVLDILKRETNACHVDTACDACSVHGTRNLHCADCDMQLCTKCLHAHHDNVITRGNSHENAQSLTQNEKGVSLKEIENELGKIPTRNESKGDEVRNEIGSHSTQNATAFAREHQLHMPLKCKKHRQDLTFFCNSCAELSCQECVIAKHIAHIFVAASDAAPSSRAQLSTLLNQTAMRILYLSEALRETKDTETQLESCVEEIRNIICGTAKETLMKNSEAEPCPLSTEMTGDREEQGRFACVHKKLADYDEKSENAFGDKLKKSFITPQLLNHSVSVERGLKLSPKGEALSKKLNKISKRKFDVLAGHRRKLETRLALIENCQRFTMNLILNGSDEEVLILENCIMESLGQLCQNTPEVPIECPDDGYIALIGSLASTAECTRLPEGKFSKEERGGAESTEEDLKMISGEGCCSCCFATGSGLSNAIVGHDCTFTVTVKNEANKACVEGPRSLVARIKTPNGGYFRAQLVEHKLGKHKFRYRTYAAGPHFLRITLRGEEILGSPFETLSSGSTDYSRRGRLVTKCGRLGDGVGELCQPQGLAIDRLSRILVADTGNHRIQVFDENGRCLFAFGRRGTGPGEFDEPCDVTIARTGHVIVADKMNNRLQFFTPDGKFVREMCCGISQPVAVSTDHYNNIVIVDSDGSQAVVINTNGKRLRSITRGSSANARLENVHAVACNQTGETFLISRIPAPKSDAATEESHASLVQVFDNNGGYIREFVTPSYTRTIPTDLCRLATDNDDRVLATGSGNKVQVFTRVGGHLTNITFTEKEWKQIDIGAIALSPSESVVVCDKINGRILVF